MLTDGGMRSQETAKSAVTARSTEKDLTGSIGNDQTNFAAVLGLGWLFAITPGEWMAVVLAIGLVWVAEALNTAIEYVADLAHPDEHPEVKKLKDLAAAAVLFASIAALVVGLIVFLPRL